MFTIWLRLNVLFLAALLVSATQVHAQPDETVRVRLFEQAAPTKIRIAGHQGPVRVYAGDFTQEIALLEPGDEAVMTRASNQLHIQIGDTGIFASAIRVEPTAEAQIMLRVAEGRSPTQPRFYQGKTRITLDESNWELKVVNEIGLEDYVAAVVSTEYGFDDLEGAKAMAVIIRTYTLAVMNKYGTEYDHVDHTLSQVYRGTERVTPTIRQAVRQTQGQILSHRDRLIEAVYFSASGGHTADNETVWRSQPLPYLRGKPDPYGTSAPHDEWSVRISRPRLLSALSAAYGDVTGFVIGERGDDGRVTSVDLLDAGGGRRNIRANEFRMLVLKSFGDTTLRSTLFSARRQGDEYVFEGKGSGHGVGLSQWGAHDLAQRNAPYTEILDFYYTDVQLEDLDDLRARQKQPRAVVEPQKEPQDQPQKPTGRIGW